MPNNADRFQVTTELPDGLDLDTLLVMDHVRVDDDEARALLTEYLFGAIELIEAEAKVSILESGRLRTMHSFDCPVSLDMPPVTSIVSVQKYDSNNQLQTLVEGTDYWIQKSSEGPAKLFPIRCQSAYCRPDAFEIRYMAGMTVVPKYLTQCFRQIVSDWNENRENQVIGTIVNRVDLGVDRCINLLKSQYAGGYA